MIMVANLDLIRSTYEGSSEDKGRNLLAVRGMNRESAAGLLIRLDI